MDMRFTRTTQADFIGARGLSQLKGFVSPLTDETAFSARIRSVRAAHFVVTYAAASPCQIIKETGKAGPNHLQMIFPLDTPISLENRSPYSVSAGGMLVSNLNDRPLLCLDSPGRSMIVSILNGGRPMGILSPPESRYLTLASSPSLAVLRAAAEILFRSPNRDVVGLLSKICRTILVDAYIDSASEEGTNKLFAQAHKVIAERFRDSELSARSLARELGVSLRTLQRAFVNEGGTASAMRAYRTQEALRILGSEGRKRLNLDAVALRSGFSDSRSMRSAIIANTGMLPSVYRQNFS